MAAAAAICWGLVSKGRGYRWSRGGLDVLGGLGEGGRKVVLYKKMDDDPYIRSLVEVEDRARELGNKGRV